jgi:hypothetical protein
MFTAESLNWFTREFAETGRFGGEQSLFFGDCMERFCEAFPGSMGRRSASDILNACFWKYHTGLQHKITGIASSVDMKQAGSIKHLADCPIALH